MLNRRKKPAIGQVVEFAQSVNGDRVYFPFIVSHVHDDGTVSGVAFTGMPGAVGWGNRGAQPFDHVSQGKNNREWRFHKGGVDVIDSDEELDTPEVETQEGEPSQEEVLSEDATPQEGDDEE